MEMGRGSAELVTEQYLNPVGMKKVFVNNIKKRYEYAN